MKVDGYAGKRTSDALIRVTGHLLAGDNGKTETWVVVAAEPGSVIYAGLERGVTRGPQQ